MSQEAMMNVAKWTEKTVEAVRNACNQKVTECQAICVGFSLVFFDPMAPEDEQWSFMIKMAYDPHDPPGEDERRRLENAMEFISAGVRKIMDPEGPVEVH